MKLITTLVKLSMLLILIGQICMNDLKSQSETLERREEKGDRISKKEKSAHTAAKKEAKKNDKLDAKKKYEEDFSKSVLLDGSNYTKFLVLGDTGQVDTYFKDLVERELTKVDELKELSEGKFENFEKIMKAIEEVKKPEIAIYDQGVILGDFIYTENKNGNVQLDKIAEGQNLEKLKEERKIKYNGKDVTDLFQKRVEKSAEKLTNLLRDSYTTKVSSWLLLNGNHSYDIDSEAERKAMNSDKTKVRMYKHSKVHVSKHACFADLNFGDLVCLNQSYKDCLGGALGASRYGRNEPQTKASLEKTIEAILTLKLCKDQWRIIRTHAAPFNSEVDQNYLFNPFEGEIKCRLRNDIPGLSLSARDTKMRPYTEVIDQIEHSNVKFTYELLRDNSQEITKVDLKIQDIKAVENRLFKCEVSGKARTYSVMDIIDKAEPHFFLGSHLHASQLLFASKKMNHHNFNDFKKSKSTEIKGEKGCKEINYIKKYAELQPNLDYERKACDPQGKATEDTIKINKDKPEYHIIFVIGNSGRFLDNFFKGNKSGSHIVWQRINTSKDGLALELLSLAKEKIKEGKNDITVQQILDADKATAYGFAELVTESNDKAIVEFKELDPTDQKIKTVLKITLEKGTETNPKYNNEFGWKTAVDPTTTPSRKLRKIK